MKLFGTLKGIATELLDLPDEAERKRITANRVGGNWKQSAGKEIKKESPTVVIEDVPGVGISVTNGNGKELIVQEYGKNKVAIWRTDERGKVTGKPLIAQREGEAAYHINEMIG